MNAQNCPRDEGYFCRKPLDAETYFTEPPHTTRWTKFRRWFGK